MIFICCFAKYQCTSTDTNVLFAVVDGGWFDVQCESGNERFKVADWWKIFFGNLIPANWFHVWQIRFELVNSNEKKTNSRQITSGVCFISQVINNKLQKKYD